MNEDELLQLIKKAAEMAEQRGENEISIVLYHLLGAVYGGTIIETALMCQEKSKMDRANLILRLIRPWLATRRG